jgi:hypothetical protein
MNQTKLRALILSVAIASLVAGAGLIFTGALQQNALPPALKARVWADGWKSDEEIREEGPRKGHYVDYALGRGEYDRDFTGAPHSGLIATKKLIGGGVVLLTLGGGLLAWRLARIEPLR